MTVITDALLKTMELAKSKDPSYLEFFREKVIQRHVNEITNLLKSPQNMLQSLFSIVLLFYYFIFIFHYFVLVNLIENS